MHFRTKTYPVTLGSRPSPDAYIDTRAYGARPVNKRIPPAAAGITASCIGGIAQVSVSSPSTFVNGDGVLLDRCGPEPTMSAPSAPSVTPSVALAGTDTGLVANSARGSTSYCYKIVARDKNGGLTAASPETCISDGQAFLGAQNVPISHLSRSNYTVTVTTTSAHALAIGCGGANTCGEVFITGTSDNSFRGWHAVTSVPDATHFTFNGVLGTATGASTSAKGGNVMYYPCNHLSWPAVKGAWQYYIYEGARAAETRYGVSNPEGTNTDYTWDDFGPTMMGNTSFPHYVPTNAPASPISDYLSTTITSGAGTSTLTLGSAPSTTARGVSILLDSAPALRAATAAASTSSSSGTLYIPATGFNTFIVNSVADLSSYPGVAISQAGTLTLNETLILAGG